MLTKKALMPRLVHVDGKYGEARKSMRRTIRHEPCVVKRARTIVDPGGGWQRCNKRGADGSFMQGTDVNQSRSP